MILRYRDPVKGFAILTSNVKRISLNDSWLVFETTQGDFAADAAEYASANTDFQALPAYFNRAMKAANGHPIIINDVLKAYATDMNPAHCATGGENGNK